MSFAQNSCIASQRREYNGGVLLDESMPKDPLTQFTLWIEDAINRKISDATAMSLATIGANNRPQSRMVLLKKYDKKGFIFFGNYSSPKGLSLKYCSYAALLFYWGPVSRQVRVEGMVSKVSPKESDEYFASRPYESQLASVLFQQSEVISHRSVLEDAYNKQYNSKQKNVQRKEDWGGWRLIPDKFEFWQGREFRLHDRFEYLLHNNSWKIQRLSP